MNKNAIQKFAIWARNELIAQVSQRAYQYGIDESGFGDASADTLNGRLLTAEEKFQRQELIKQIKEKGYQQVMEEVAYTWFNRFIALRFMEVNNYLPSHIRVFSDASGAFKPEILNDVLHLDLPGLDSGKVAEYIESNDTEALYRYLLLTQCNALNSALPVMFERMGGYTEMLLPNNILRQDSVLGHMVSDIPEEDWQDAVQIIGWLYQYYNTELKDDTFAQLKKNVKITKERIPAATQLFTPDWIVRYMVENSLGRLWLEHLKAEAEDGTLHIPAGVPIRQEGSTVYVDSASEQDAEDNFASYFKTNWKYYLDEAKQEPDVEARLREVRKSYKDLSLKEIKVIDPCMGSGHILVYAFDVLMQIYTSAGWDQREAAQSILKNNLFGLDIDDRAAQLAYFAVMMKARQYDRRLLTRGIQPNIYSIRESNGIQAMTIEYFHKNDPKLKADIERIVTEMRDAKEYGSILNITPVDFAGLYARFDEIREDIDMMQKPALEELLPLVKCAELLAQKYDVVVTNPPYMGASGMNARLAQHIKDHFPDTKADLFSCFIERGFQLANVQGFVSMITMESWMFLSSFEKMRQNIVNTHTIINMVHMPYLGKGGTSLGINFGTAAVIFNKRYCRDYNSQFDYICYYETDENGVPFAFPTVNERYKAAKATNFSKIPGSPVAYWACKEMANAFSNLQMKEYIHPKQGTSTGDDEKFVRYWCEVNRPEFSPSQRDLDTALHSDYKWFPLDKGGEYRKWYGNNEKVIRMDKDAYEQLLQMGNHLPSKNMYFKPGITWSKITSAKISFRYDDYGFVFSSVGLKGFPIEGEDYYALALLNSQVVEYCLNILSPGLSTVSGDIEKLPVIHSTQHKNRISTIGKENIQYAKVDWDSYETSWDFKRNPLV